MSKGRYGSTWPAKSELLKLKTNRIWFDKFTMNVLHMYYFSIGTEFVIDIINSLVWDTLYLSALSRKKNLQMGAHPCQILANCCFTEEILPTSGSLPDPCHLLFCKQFSFMLKILFYVTRDLLFHATCDTWLSLMFDAERL